MYASESDAARQWITDQIAQLNEAELLQVKAKLNELRVAVPAMSCTCPLGPEDAHFPDCPMYVGPVADRRLAVGDRVEIEDAARRPENFTKATLVERPADRFAPNDHEAWVWVKHDGTGDICPVREWHVRRVPPTTSR